MTEPTAPTTPNAPSAPNSVEYDEGAIKNLIAELGAAQSSLGTFDLVSSETLALDENLREFVDRLHAATRASLSLASSLAHEQLSFVEFLDASDPGDTEGEGDDYDGSVLYDQDATFIAQVVASYRDSLEKTLELIPETEKAKRSEIKRTLSASRQALEIIEQISVYTSEEDG